jgi:deltex-like protein
MKKATRKAKPQKRSEIKSSNIQNKLQQDLLIVDINAKSYNQQMLTIDSVAEEISRPLSVIAQMKTFTYEQFHGLSTHHNPEEEKCPICMCEFTEEDTNKIAKLDKCEGHYFHIECIEMCHKGAHLRCPICGIIYGIMTGDMPSGTMCVVQYPPSSLTLDGYPNVPVLEIIYSMKSGNRGGIHYGGTTRYAFLPYNDEGNEILRLLIIAFERRLTFTIGTSVTTGRTNQIIWNGIHHKTSTEGGPTFFGYPDETYFKRIREELAAKGIY